MIKKSTVFILGAGASAPYGFPYGSCYKQAVLEALSLRRYDSAWGNTTKKQRDDVCNAFQDQDDSIDQFLQKNNDMLPIGKKAIQIAILEHEGRSKQNLMDPGPGRWYHILFDHMDTQEGEIFGNNEVTLITFNYDRSLEYFLFKKLSEKYPDRSPGDVGEMMINDPKLNSEHKIFYYHVYGLLAFAHFDPLHQKYCDTLDYGTDIVASAVNKGLEHIELVGNSTAPQRLIPDNVLNQIRNSQRVVFLGFGFHKDNFKLFTKPGDIWKDKHVWMTTMGGEIEKQREAQDTLHKFGVSSIKMGKPDDDIHDFLVNSGKDIFSD